MRVDSPNGFISVVITCFNEAEIIGDAITSVMSQTYFSSILEVIVVDDGSSDNSREVIEAYCNKYSKLTYHYQTNGGLAAARNAGIELCQGEYIAFLDGDDIWAEIKIERIVDAIMKHPGVGLFYSSFVEKSRTNQLSRKVTPHPYYEWDSALLKRFYIKGGPVLPSSVVLKKDILKITGLFNPEFKKAQDTELWLRIAGVSSFHFVRENLVFRMITAGSLGSNSLDKAKYLFAALDRIELSYPFLKKYRSKREAIILSKIALYLLRSGNKKLAFKYALQSAKKDWKYFKGYRVFAQLLKP